MVGFECRTSAVFHSEILVRKVTNMLRRISQRTVREKDVVTVLDESDLCSTTGCISVVSVLLMLVCLVHSNL